MIKALADKDRPSELFVRYWVKFIFPLEVLISHTPPSPCSGSRTVPLDVVISNNFDVSREPVTLPLEVSICSFGASLLARRTPPLLL